MVGDQGRQAVADMALVKILRLSCSGDRGEWKTRRKRAGRSIVVAGCPGNPSTHKKHFLRMDPRGKPAHASVLRPPQRHHTCAEATSRLTASVALIGRSKRSRMPSSKAGTMGFVVDVRSSAARYAGVLESS